MNYGKELIIDMHQVKNTHLFNRTDLEKFMIQLCKILKMNREDLHFWDELYTPEEEKYTEEHLVGTSAVQFITTSNITIHTLDIMKRVYLNIFSCKNFNSIKARKFCKNWFNGSIVNYKVINRL